MRHRYGFTLIELLVVVAIIGILAAILFPVFAHSRERGRQTACLSNQTQIGRAIELYLQENDDTLFFFASKAVPSKSRSGAIVEGSADPVRWWNALMPGPRSRQILRCPSDDEPTESADASGQKTLLRSYIASRAVESLALSQVYDPQEALVITEKWGTDSDGKPVTDSWIEPFNGDFNVNAETGRMALAANRHGGALNGSFLDGHSRSMRPDQITGSVDLSGCGLIHAYPMISQPAASDDMCEKSVAGCVNTGDENLCNRFAYPLR